MDITKIYDRYLKLDNYIISFDVNNITEEEIEMLLYSINDIDNNIHIYYITTNNNKYFVFTEKKDIVLFITYIKCLIHNNLNFEFLKTKNIYYTVHNNLYELFNKKNALYQWNQGPYKNIAELVPLSFLTNLIGNKLSKANKNSLSYNPDIDDYDQGTFDDLMKSMNEYGLQNPIIMYVSVQDGRAFVEDGNHRLAAASELGWIELPTIVRLVDKAPITHCNILTEQEKKLPLKLLRGKGMYSHDVKYYLTWDISEIDTYPNLGITKPSKVFKNLGHTK